MSTDKFDNEIAQLYQQRKHQVVAPQIKLQQEPIYHKYSPLKLLTFFLAGGMASFGIMAVISHLSTNQNKIIVPVMNSQAIELIELTPNKVTEKTLVIIKPLPAMPEVNTPVTPLILPDHVITNTHTIKPVELKVNLIQVVTVPQLTEPTLVNEPIYKVLPEYSVDARNNNQAGEVKLNYQIDSFGKVNNIKIVSSSVDRNLQRTTKKALSQWLYKPNAQLSGEHEIIFKFTMTKD